MISFECFFIGHDDRLARARNRIFLHCARCGRETAGWVIEGHGSRSRETVEKRASRRHAGLIWLREFPHRPRNSSI